MYNRKSIVNMYNNVSDNKIDEEKLCEILPKLYMIVNKIKADEVEVIELIDVLNELKQNKILEKISPEIIDLIIKVTKSNWIDMNDNHYFNIVLKHVLLPFNKDICENDYNLVVFLSDFEIFIELANKLLKNKELEVLDKYNHELKQVIINYKDMQRLYKRYVINDVILNQMTSHFASMLYFNLEEFDYDYDLLIELLEKCILNYQSFIDYCCSLGIHKNFTRINNDIESIEMEYIIGYEMLKFIYNNKKAEKIKRK